MFEYAVVIRRQLREGGARWQLWLAPGLEVEDVLFLRVMNHAGALGFEAVSAGHFDELAVPEVLLQRRLGAAPVEIEVAGGAAQPAVAAPKRAAKAATSKPAPRKTGAKRS